MRLKRITTVLVCVLALICCSFGSVTVFAEPVDYQDLKGLLFESDETFFYDEMSWTGFDTADTIRSQLESMSETFQMNVGLYLAVGGRTQEEMDQAAIDGAEMLDDKSGAFNTSVFLFFDTSEKSENSLHLAFVQKDSEKRITAAQQKKIKQLIREDMSRAASEHEAFLLDEPLYRRKALSAATAFGRALSSELGIELKTDHNGIEATYHEGSVYLHDEPGIFTEEQQKKILETLGAASDSIGFNVALFIGGIDRTDGEIEGLSESMAHTLFDKETYNGTVFCYIDFDGHKNAYDYIFAADDAFLYYTNGDDGTEDRVDNILASMELNFPSGGGEVVPDEILKGITEFCRQLRIYKEEGPVNNIYYIDAETGEYVYASNERIVHSGFRPYYHWMWAMAIGIIVSVVILMIVITSIRKRYKFKESVSASVYTSKQKMHMREKTDDFIGRNVIKTKIQSSSGSHGGGGGGGHGGGHVGGGGGGRHR